MLMLDNGTNGALKGTVDWTRRSISLPVPPDAAAWLQKAPGCAGR